MTDKMNLYFEKRLWYELGNEIIENINKDYRISYDYLMKSHKFIHPITLTKILCEMIKISQGDPKEIYEIINSIEDHPQLVLSVKIHYLLVLIRNDLVNFNESDVYLILNENLNSENNKLAKALAFNYYVSIENYDEALKYVCDSEHIDPYNLCFSCLSSLSYFNFLEIIDLNIFNSMRDCEIKSLIQRLADNDFRIPDLSIHNLNSDTINRKFKILQITSLIRAYSSNIISFDYLTDNIQVSENDLIKLLMIAIGAKVINGWIDHESKTFNCISLSPIKLKAEDVVRIKDRFIELRDKVNHVINLL
ncbi:hypothetical protein HERIO_1625 [Hepatospora eriocheir]|uniref:PCI domain-containing protein n=1 Tax=Hepatospora eriocheir TaxID=1081669 RepID=A0A1X0Q9L3_9MICR|nr:hypothetical protein HERIO_1625 [Hepatospora eriocheir]